MIEYILGLENDVVPLSFHDLSHWKEISKDNSDNFVELTKSLICFFVGYLSLRSPSNMKDDYWLNTSISWFYSLYILKAFT
jgi:hypothetical protein